MMLPATPQPEPEDGAPRGRTPTWLRRRISEAVGVTPATRFATARAMLDSHGRDPFGYWLELVLSMGIATFGLVLGSTGVVIGAMLVSPLMGPLVEIGMGLVVGSPRLVVHAGLRTASSVAVVILLSALLTLLLPYYEATPEIVARTSPTLLDLYVACFCALVAAYTTVRKGSDTVTTAAGTAISIALVPPLCVVGWGIGSRNAHAWRGAMLLFTANFCAIILFSVVAFAVLAYDTVDVIALERHTEGTTRVDRFASRLRQLFGSKYGPALRLLMPLVLAGAVFVPLRTALNEVPWTIKTRAAIQSLLDGLPQTSRAVRCVVSVEHHTVAIQLLVVGDSQTAAKLRTALTPQVAAASGVVPSINIVAVPDADDVRVATPSLATPPPIVAPPKPDLALAEQELGAELNGKWPASVAGELLAWRIVVQPGGGTGVEVVHFGKPLGPVGEKLLADTLGQRIGQELAIHDITLTESRMAVAPERGLEWLPELSLAIDQVVVAKVAYVCITSAAGAANGAAREQAAMVEEQIKQAVKRLPPDRSSVKPGHEWSVALSAKPCPAPAKAASSDAGED